MRRLNNFWMTLTEQLPAILLAAAVALSASACQTMSSTSPSATSSDVSSTADTGYNADLGLCVDEINRYRASIGRPALRRSSALEAFSAAVAEHDASVRIAHAHFLDTNGGGVARAETEILWWRGYGVSAVVKKGLAQMWQVGPGGEHYDIIAGPYTEVGCGIYVSQIGEVTVSQDFR